MTHPHGVSTREPDTLLTARARDFLGAGPADSATLVARVCQLPGVPASVAEHLAETLLGGRGEFARTSDGAWVLAPGGAVPATSLGDVPAGVSGGDGTGRLRVAESLGPGAPYDRRSLGASVSSPVAAGFGASPVAPCEPLGEMSFVVVDVETTGGRPLGGDRITEFAAVVVRGGEIAERYETLVNPCRPIPPWISRLTNISWDMVREAPRFSDVCSDVLRIMEGHVFVAHNARFDWGFVSMEIARASGQQLDGRQLCTVRLARRLLPQLRRRSLDYVADHYNVGIGARHRAMGDALATAHVLVGLLRDAESRGCTTWAELQQLLSTTASTKRRRRPSALPTPVTLDTTA